MLSNVKISVIGAGGSFAIGLIHDICLTPNLHGCTVSLMDINAERLDNALAVCTRHAKEMGAPIRFEKTLDREASLAGADFVVNIALRDGARRIREGWEIARKHGAQFGASYHILYDEPFWLNFYQLRFFESLTQDMLRICPQAWHLMVANPVLAGTTYLTRKYPESKMVGLCHGFAEVYRIADILGLEREHLTFEIPGLNHFVWLTHAYHKGQDIFPMIDRWIETESEAYWKTTTGGVFSPKKIDLYQRFGALPIGDTANWTGASWPWWYHTDTETEKRWRTDSCGPWMKYLDGMANGAKRLQQIAADTKTPVLKAYGLRPGLTGEPMIPIVESVAYDVPRVIIVNMQNTGQFIPGIPSDFEVEIPALVSKRGIEGIRTCGLPQPILAWALRDRVAPVKLELEAYETGRRELLVQLVLMDKWTPSEQAARDLVDEVLALPYHTELREHYR